MTDTEVTSIRLDLEREGDIKGWAEYELGIAPTTNLSSFNSSEINQDDFQDILGELMIPRGVYLKSFGSDLATLLIPVEIIEPLKSFWRENGLITVDQQPCILSRDDRPEEQVTVSRPPHKDVTKGEFRQSVFQLLGMDFRIWVGWINPRSQARIRIRPQDRDSLKKKIHTKLRLHAQDAIG